MNTIITRIRRSKAVLVFSIVYAIGFFTMLYGGGVFASKAALHVSLWLMIAAAPVAALGTVFAQTLFRRPTEQRAVC